jgi:hypothetical protein
MDWLTRTKLPVGKIARAATLLAVAVPGFAAAPLWADECPTHADLATGGVVLERSDPFLRLRYRAEDDGPGLVARRSVLPGAPARLDRVSRYAHALAVAGLSGPGGQMAFTYAGDLARVDEIDALGELAVPVTATLNGAPASTGTLHLTYLGAGAIDLGNCHYDTWHLRSELALDGVPTVESEVDYAPALGLVLRELRKTEDCELVVIAGYDAIRADMGE